MPSKKEINSDSSFSGSSDSDSEDADRATITSSAPTKKIVRSTGIKRIITASNSLKDIPKPKVTAASKRKKGDQEPALTSKPKRKVYKKNNKSSWPNIFAQCKAVVSISNLKSSDEKHSGIMINFCDSDFLSTFGYVDCASGLYLNSMMGKASSVDTMSKLETFLRLGRTATEYINLYRSDGITPLSCHISLLPLKSHRECANNEQSSSSSMADFTGTESHNIALWGVITIRSASCVGNARFSGLSFLGMDRVSDAVRQDYYNNKIMNGTTEIVETTSSIKKKSDTDKKQHRKIDDSHLKDISYSDEASV